ncbi:hypothetical protein BOTBODRAFT_38014 [Botryobasidium botryosum FD-172 SS1]|uniref:Uncharacterized protein n=1 Tax=Botryobasidium botryosum (strain FD-172 SS1) TaxID=930990 RepID=A0A067LY80_BOTB1|nr:hypothetical protein BOTBODRAFT_38014 [Botryobasidium botryosum FD-172 SS1]
MSSTAPETSGDAAKTTAPLARQRHVDHCMLCLRGLPGKYAEADSARYAVSVVW